VLLSPCLVECLPRALLFLFPILWHNFPAQALCHRLVQAGLVWRRGATRTPNMLGGLDRLCNDVPSARTPSAVLIVVKTTGVTECVPQAVEELTKGEGHINFEGVESRPHRSRIFSRTRGTPRSSASTFHIGKECSAMPISVKNTLTGSSTPSRRSRAR
jgi:hypothetical protein